MKDDFTSDKEVNNASIGKDIHKSITTPTPENDLNPGDYFVAEIEDDTKTELKPIIVSKDKRSILKDKKHKKLLLNKEGSQHSFFLSKIVRKKKPFWKRRMFNFAVVLVLGIVTGSLIGSWYSDFIKPKEVVWPEEATIRDTQEEVLTALNRITNSSNSNFETWLETAKDKGITPKELTASQSFMLAEYNASKAESFEVIGKGKVATIATQSVYSRKAFNGSKYTFESISKGLLTIATCSVMKKNASNVKIIQGENVKEDGADWTGKSTSYTTSEFYDFAGCTPNVLVPYIISSKTVLYENTIEVVQTTYKDTPVYKYTMQLKTEASEMYYVREVKQKSGLDNYPEFFDITFTMMIDENWNFVHTDIIENYKVVAFKAPANCQGTMSQDYIFNQPVILPA